MFASGTSWRLGSLFGTPIFVQPGYLLLLLLFGYFASRGLPHAPFLAAFLTAFAVTVSLLIHEFGHVLAARLNGHRSQVVLVMMGGLTISSGESRGWRAVMLSLAGPAAGLLTWAILVFVVPASRAEDPTLWPYLWGMLVWINLYWSIFNLLPIYPMDGGQALQSLLKLFKRAFEAERISAIVSIVTALAVALWLYQFGFIFAVFLLAMMAYENWERLGRNR